MTALTHANIRLGHWGQFVEVKLNYFNYGRQFLPRSVPHDYFGLPSCYRQDFIVDVIEYWSAFLVVS